MIKKRVLETELVLQETYKVTIDASGIDQYLDRIKGLNPDEKEKEHKKFHRMFKAIMANEEAGQAVLEYEALSQHAGESGTGYGHLESNYSNYEREDIGFHIILTQFAHIFVQEDREWWLGLVKKHENFMATHGKEENYWEHEDHFDLDDQVEALNACFQAKYSCWDIHEHLCARGVLTEQSEDSEDNQ